jgi:hypothetical protein
VSKVLWIWFEKDIRSHLTTRSKTGMIKGCRWLRRVFDRYLIIEFGNLDVRGELVDLAPVRGARESLDRTFL